MISRKTQKSLAIKCPPVPLVHILQEPPLTLALVVLNQAKEYNVGQEESNAQGCDVAAHPACRSGHHDRWEGTSKGKAGEDSDQEARVGRSRIEAGLGEDRVDVLDDCLGVGEAEELLSAGSQATGWVEHGLGTPTIRWSQEDWASPVF